MRTKDARHDYSCNITFLCSDITDNEMEKVVMLVDIANKMVEEYFGIPPSFDILICRRRWEMEAISGIDCNSGSAMPFQIYDDDNKSIAITDYDLQEIIIRLDAAKFGHYLHEIILSIMSKGNTLQLREALAWYFTLKLTDSCKYIRPSYSYLVDRLYINPAKRLANLVGDDFLKDLATGRASVYEEALPPDIKELFQPEAAFYGKRRYY